MLPRTTLALFVALVAITGAIFVAPRLDPDVRVEASIVVMIAAAVFALVAWALTPPP